MNASGSRAGTAGPDRAVEVLAGDIGATRSRFALVAVRDSGPEVREREEYASSDFRGLDEVAGRYVDGLEDRPERAVFAVAAPVRGGRARFANLPWEADSDEVARAIGVDDVRLINDYEAVCHALPLLGGEDVVDLIDGSPEPGGTVAVLGAGTGLGHAFATREDGERRVHSSEAGHVDFGPRTGTQDALLGWLRARYGRASPERVVSGPGLVDVYRFLLETARAERMPETAARAASEDPAAVISERGLAASDPACERALALFAEAYGAHAANFALAVQATGGVYLGGGISPKILPVLRGDRFREAFRNKGKMAEFVERIPVRVITDPDAGLLGAAAAARG